MKFLLAVICASITGISLGIALYHKQSIAKPEFPEPSPYAYPPTYGYHFQGSSDAAQPVIIPTSQPANVDYLEKKLVELVEQQEIMRNQQSEINREINAIQFRLDTHSSQFRPIRMEQDTVPQPGSPLSSPLLPPLQK